MLFIVSLILILRPSDAQKISVDLNLSNNMLKPIPTSIQFILSGKDSTYRQIFGISGNHTNYILDNIQSGSYRMHLQLFNKKDIILEGFGRGQVSTSHKTFVKSHISSVNDSLYLLVDWEKNPELKSQSLFDHNIDLDTSELKIYPIHNADSLADVWLSKGMPNYNHYDVNYGILDPNLVPIIKYSWGDYRNPVSTAQVAFAFYEDLLRTNDPEYEKGFLNNVDWLVENHDTNFYYHYNFDFIHGGRKLNQGWVSAMAQGMALGAVSIAYHYTGDSIYLNTADGIFNTLFSNNENFWCVLVDENQYYWLEEYPNEDTCHVLNGKIAGLFGLWEYFVITRNPFALKLFQAGIRTITDHLSYWNIPDQNYSYYCLHHSSYLAYHLLHLYQLDFLGNVFGIKELVDAVGLFSDHNFSVYPASRSLSPDEGLTQFNIFNANNWESSTNSTWLEINSFEPNVVKVHYECNRTIQEKSGGIMVTEGSSQDSKSLLLTQQKGEPFFFFVPDTVRIPNEAGVFELKIYSNLTWEDQSDSSWYSTTKLNDSTLIISFFENPENQQRNSELIVSTNLDSTFMIPIIQTVIQASAVSPIVDPGIIFYPNPAHDRFTISSRHLLIGGLEIFSMTGEKVLAIPLKSGFYDIIDVSLIPPGIYMVKVQTKESPVFKKLIIN